ncbi:uncharacterized protein N7473_006045 [Penicillium subrubescens]|uniref:Uncharacterized protein n=1 Tax=Penicillium subrubescens TaxID=1316194 RepID=A0A1Q5URN1_9EURO|nr:uncharacterized protein N7473_006045 [Penicillium subrubescens]KAJ5896646.1 hypothetical protein N7473_006045 [Penicillium subrubescens]OKP15125.1 hypothetical protein PENSUB_2167 [Penicillium subrubescens]
MVMALSKGLAVSGAPSRADLGSASLTLSTAVTIMSVVTETVHPTLIVTEVTTAGSSQLETSRTSAGQPQSETSSSLTVQSGAVQTDASETDQTQTVQMALSTSSTIPQLTVLVPESTTTAMTTATWSTDDPASFSAAAAQSSVYLPPVVGHSNADAQTSSSELLPVSSSFTTSVQSSTASSPLASATASTASTVLDVTTTIPTTTSTQLSSSTLITSSFVPIVSSSAKSQSLISSPSPSPSSSPVGAIISSSDSTTAQTSESQYTSHVGAIVGGSVGGAVFVALALLACMLCLRRRRQKAPIKPLGSPRRGLLRNSSDSLTTFRGPQGWHGQQDSQSSYPMGPMFSPRGNTISLAPAPNPALAASYQGPPPVTMFVHRDSGQNPFSDPEHSPVSPIINVHPPSRTASTYSQSSCEGGLGYLEKYDYESPTRSSRYESIYYPDDNVATPILPEDDKLAPLETCKTRLSTRSDPFDLEIPRKVLHEWPLPPRPTPWGDNF